MERILIVDDEIEICNALKEYLSIKGYTVETAQDGTRALEKIKDFNPHIVLLDIIMPKIGGIDLLLKIKKINPKTGVVMITAVTDESIGRKAMALGAYDYITKPLDLKHLETVLMVKMVEING
jgi:DNA-binding response OmpR family regulator